MKFGLFIFAAVLAFFFASQVYWLRRLRELVSRLVSRRRLRKAVLTLGLAVYFVAFIYNFTHGFFAHSPTHLTLQAALLDAPFKWWAFSSLLGFSIVVLFWMVRHAAHGVSWGYHKLVSPEKQIRIDLNAPDRRRFLERTALALGTAPFAIDAYGLFYGRLNLKTPTVKIHLKRLPKAFDGFRIVQLSDIHIGPFMGVKEILHCVQVANNLKPDLIALTGDFVTWDASTQGAVVKALAGLKAPFGIYGCLGNHEIYTHTEASITRLFANEGVHILRYERAAIELRGEKLNLIGVDFETTRHWELHRAGNVKTYLEGVERLVEPDTANILFSHNPNTFNRAADLGIDLSLAGHTHGGQVALEFVHRNISPGRLMTPYVRGWFQRDEAQLYVNRGIGTIIVPIRIDAPPEITLFELVRSV